MPELHLCMNDGVPLGYGGTYVHGWRSEKQWWCQSCGHTEWEDIGPYLDDYQLFERDVLRPLMASDRE